MPIREEFRHWYGRDWRAYRRALIAIHGKRCTECGRWVGRYLNLAHVTHDPRTSEVRLMCAACHNRHDAAHRLAVWRRNRAEQAGQLWLSEDLERAPYAAVPPAARQEEMFE